MAGGKISPRQKMINMMYLVLTALLALNVSAEVLKSFELISNSLKESSDRLNQKNDDLGASLKTAVQKEMATGNKKNESILKLTDELNTRTDDLVHYLDGTIATLYEDKWIGKDPATGKLKKSGETETNYRFFMQRDGRDTDNGGRGAGEAKIMRDKLTEYVDWANKWYADNNRGKKANNGQGFAYLAIDPKDDPNIKAGDDVKDKTWEYMLFHSVPAEANIAMIEKFKNDVRVLEAQLLEMLRQKLNEIEFKIDSIMPMDAPVSQVVAAGMPFKTKLFVTMSSRQIKPTFSGPGIVVDPNGNSATMTVIANGGVIPAGKNEGEQAYSATIMVPKASGEMQKLVINNRFKVRKPEVVVTSAAINNMYQNCLNEINVDVPALGDLYDPRITSTEATVVTFKESKRKIGIIPTGKKTVMSVNSATGGQIVKVGDLTYTVIPPPKPTLSLFVNGQRYDGISLVSKAAPVDVKVTPDKNFADALPKDAKYQLVNAVMKAQIGLGAPQQVAAPQTSNVAKEPTLSFKIPRDLNPGTLCFIQIDKIVRNNFEKKSIEERFNQLETTLKFTVR
jgi:gliding motility-associated protein GldM